MSQTPQTLPLRGGLDIVTPAMMVKPGYAIAAINYEVEARGYRRCEGYERFDGQPKPSDSTYVLLGLRQGTASIAEGDVVTGATSGATGIAIEDSTLTGGSYAEGDARSDVYLYNFDGVFEIDEPVEVSGSQVAVMDTGPYQDGAPFDAENAALIAAVRAKRRAVIGKVPGIGPVIGVLSYKGDIYAFRNAADGLSLGMFKATPTGWQQQTFGTLLRFESGSGEFVQGETVTGGTSGATATVERVALTYGAWDSSAEGYLVLSGTSGSFTSGETLSGDASGAASAAEASEAITLAPGERVRGVTENFYATRGFERLYFVTGGGPAMEWDGAVLAPAYTGLDVEKEKPTHIATHNLHLFLGYREGSLMHSAPGQPIVFDPVQGAGEIGFGQRLTGMKGNTKDSLIVTSRNKIGYLVGTDSATFDMKFLSEDSGAYEDTLEVVGSPLLLDDQGIRDMQAAQAYGDWKIGTMTKLVEPLIRQKRDSDVKPVGALRVRGKDQYRLFYEDGSGLVIYFGRDTPETMPLEMGFIPSCLLSGETLDGAEVLFAGTTEGWVMQMDRGPSFDGEPLRAYLRLAFLNQGSPNQVKRYHRARLEGQAGETNSAISIICDFTYGDPEYTPGLETIMTFYGGGGFWNEANWNEFVWSSKIEGQAFADLEGLGENISIVFISESDVELPHTLSALTINYSRRRKVR